MFYQPYNFQQTLYCTFRILCVISFIVVLPLLSLSYHSAFFPGNDWLYAGLYAHLCPSLFRRLLVFDYVYFSSRAATLWLDFSVILSTLNSFFIFLSFFLFASLHSYLYIQVASSISPWLILGFRSLNIPVRQYINHAFRLTYLFSIYPSISTLSTLFKEYGCFQLDTCISFFSFYLYMSFLRLKPLYLILVLS